MSDGPAALARCHALLNFLVGQVLKRESRANPQVVRRLLMERLEQDP